MQNQNVTGTIVSLLDKGFGFIGVSGYDKNIFFHAKACSGVRFEELQKGDKVEIGEIRKNNDAYSAHHVSLITVE